MKGLSYFFLGLILGAAIILNFTKNKTADNNSAQDQVAGTQTTASNPNNAIAKVNIDDDPYLGDKTQAKIAIVEFSDYECPFCKKFHDQTFDDLVKEYVDTRKAIIVFRDFPLSFHNPAATTSANAAQCVKDLGDNKKYFEMMKLIYQNTALNGQGMAKEKYIELASRIGVNTDKFKTCFESNKFSEEIKKDVTDGSQAGINGTPGFVIGKLKANGEVEGELVSGAQPLSVFQAALERQSK